jgi:hypothetical protein
MNDHEYERGLAEQASAWMDEQSRLAGLPPEYNEPVSPKVIAMLGQEMAKLTSQDKTDAEALDEAWKKGGDRAPLIRSMIAKPPENAVLIGGFRWLGCGLPQITMGHKYAAALLATAVPPEIIPHVVEPWRAFVIQVPNGLIMADNGHGKLTEVRSVLVVRLDGSAQGKWCYVAITTSAVLLWRFSPDLGDLLREGMNANAYDGYSFLLDFEDVDDRAAALIGRLVVNTCLAMSDPSNFKAPRPSSPKAAAKAKRRGEPVVATYVLGKPIKIDCRAEVQAYARGERKAPSVQCLVRGHWKRQPHGPGRTQRKLIHVEPYWRGPEDAPINVKALNLGKDKP